MLRYRNTAFTNEWNALLRLKLRLDCNQVKLQPIIIKSPAVYTMKIMTIIIKLCLDLTFINEFE